MADGRTCDTCGASPARRVEAAVAIYALIPPDVATGHSEGADACEEHQIAILTALHNSSVAILLEQAPFISEANAARAERDAARAELDDMRPVLEGIVEGGAVPPAIAKLYRAAQDKFASAEGRRVDALRRGTAASDSRVASLRRTLSAGTTRTKKG